MAHRSIGSGLLVAVAAAVALLPVGAQGQTPAEGALTPRVVAQADASQSYAVLLPPGHDPARRWPALILMDPRGRALRAVERFREAAARHGYVLLSSYDTSSDQPTSGADTRRAVEVILNDAVARYGIDVRRLYLGGFSGTARMAWVMAGDNPGLFAGIAGFGAGAPAGTVLARAAGLPAYEGVYFGGAGTLDFNFMEVRRTDRHLDAAGVLHAARYYPGGHDWPPPRVAEEALLWFELGERSRGATAADSAWVSDRLEEAVREASALELADPYAAWHRFHTLVEAFEAGAPAAAHEALERLERDPVVRETRSALERWEAWEVEAQRRSVGVVSALREERLPSADRLADRLELEAMRRQARSGDTLAAQAAERQLSTLLTLVGFYEPRAALEQGAPERAVRLLEVARRIAPEAPVICELFRRAPADSREGSRPLLEACGESPSR